MIRRRRRNGGSAMLTSSGRSVRAVSLVASLALFGCSPGSRLDVDANGKVSPGDFVGSTTAVEIRDRGVLAGNLTRGETWC
jgi:hypothetical protein